MRHGQIRGPSVLLLFYSSIYSAGSTGNGQESLTYRHLWNRGKVMNSAGASGHAQPRWPNLIRCCEPAERHSQNKRQGRRKHLQSKSLNLSDPSILDTGGGEVSLRNLAHDSQYNYRWTAHHTGGGRTEGPHRNTSVLCNSRLKTN